MQRDTFSNRWANEFLRSASVSTMDSDEAPPSQQPPPVAARRHRLYDDDDASVSTGPDGSDTDEHELLKVDVQKYDDNQRADSAIERRLEFDNQQKLGRNQNDRREEQRSFHQADNEGRNPRYVGDTLWRSNNSDTRGRSGVPAQVAADDSGVVIVHQTTAVNAPSSQQFPNDGTPRHLWSSNDASAVDKQQRREAWTPTHGVRRATTPTTRTTATTNASRTSHSPSSMSSPRNFTPLRNKSSLLRQAASRKALLEQRRFLSPTSATRREYVRFDGRDEGHRGVAVYPPKRSLYHHSNASSFMQRAPGSTTCTDFSESDADVLLKCVRCITFGNFVPQHEFRVRIGVSLGEARDIFAKLERDDGGIEDYIWRFMADRGNNMNEGAPSSSSVMSTPLRNLGILNDHNNFQHTRSSLSVPTTWCETFAHNCMSEIVAGACTECWGRWFGSVSRRRVEETLRKFTRHGGAVGMMLDRNSRGHLVQIPFVRNRY